MSTLRMKAMATAAAGLLVGAASAENYVAKIYSVPPGGSSMSVAGAGDNGMMTGSQSVGVGIFRAVYRTNSGWKFLHPAGWHSSEILDSWGSTYHCGAGTATPTSSSHALFWVGGGAAVDIHPAGAEYTSSFAVGGGGQLQAGIVIGNIACGPCGNTNSSHAGVWSRTASSFKRLHAAEHFDTGAHDTDGVRQVGDGLHRTSFQAHALLWDGPETFAINLHPAGGYNQSSAYSISGAIEGGYVSGVATGNNRHAAIWSGSAGSFIDLNPLAFLETQINTVRGDLQVGHGRPTSTPTRNQAIAWHGFANTWINLHARLPYPFNLQWQSTAHGIDAQGNITGYIQHMSTNEMRPVIWLRQP